MLQPTRTNTAQMGGFLQLQFRQGALNHSVYGCAYLIREFLAYAFIKQRQIMLHEFAIPDIVELGFFLCGTYLSTWERISSSETADST
jgi:hypothetical protein